MKTLRTLCAVLALAAVAALGGCSTTASPGGAPAVDPAAFVQAGVAAAEIGIVALEQSGKVSAADVAKFRTDVQTVLSLVAAVGPVASLADPKLAPALQALTALQISIASARAAAAPG